MSDHDPLCPFRPPTRHFALVPCQCALIERARADEREKIYGDMRATKDDIQLLLRDERERIAQAIEAHPVPESYDVGYRDGYIDAHVVAARIARAGGRDD